VIPVIKARCKGHLVQKLEYLSRQAQFTVFPPGGPGGEVRRSGGPGGPGMENLAAQDAGDFEACKIRFGFHRECAAA
jgi:hypothetical protein